MDNLSQAWLITEKLKLTRHNWKAPGNNHVTAILSEIFKYARIQPNFASRPVSCEKMFLCCFFPSKQGEKTWLTGLKFCLPPEKMLNTRDMDTLCYTTKRLLRFFQHHSGAQRKGGGGGGGVDFSSCLSSLFSMLLGKNNTGISFHITQVGLRSLAGFWHTWEFHSKWQLSGCHPEPFNYETSNILHWL